MSHESIQHLERVLGVLKRLNIQRNLCQKAPTRQRVNVKVINPDQN